MHLRIVGLLAFGLLTLCSGSAQAASSGPLHTFYGEVKAVDLAGKTLTIKAGGKKLVFQITSETKINSFHGYVRLDRIRPGQGALVVMRLGEGNKGIAVQVRIDPDASLAKSLSLYSARTIRGEMVVGIAVSNFVAYQPPGEWYNRGLHLGPSKGRMFRLSVLPDGTVGNATPYVSFGNKELDAQAVNWLKKWRFHPNSVTEVRIPVMWSWPG
jgi:TonB family protein